jgi:GNAT superfamily N-acetyltransferase
MLGRKFLRELYRGFIAERDGICWVAEATLPTGQSGVAGFVAGTLRPDRFFRRLLCRRGIYFAVAALPGIARRPFKVLPRVVSALWYRGDKPSATPSGTLLSSVGVHPSAGRRGIGTVLINAFCEHAAFLGAREVYLITDRNDNDGVNTFYERAGFHLVTTMVRRDGRTMNTYTRTTALQGDYEQ